MRKSIAVCLAFAVSVVLLSALGAEAHHHHRHHYWYGGNPYLWAPPFVVAPPIIVGPPVFAPAPIILPPPILHQPAVIQQPAPPQYWYYCPGPKVYFPYIKECPEGWLQVLPQTQPSQPQ